MKRYIRFFRNKEDSMPNNSYQLIKSNERPTNNTVFYNENTVFRFIDNWMEMYPNGKVDFVFLP